MPDVLHIEIKKVDSKIIISAETELDEVSGHPPPILPDPVTDWKKKAYGRLLGGKQTTNDGTPNEEEVKVGTGLIRLLPENVRDELSHKLRKTGVVALDFRILDSEWANLPWEACIHADWSEFKIPPPDCKLVVTRSPIRPRLNWPEVKRPIKILVAGSNPKMAASANFEAEIHEIETGLRSGLGDRYKNECILEPLRSVDLKEFGEKIKVFKPNIIHLTSHGGEGYFQLQDAMWEPRPAYSEDLGMILDELKEEHGLALFVSTACLAFSNDTKNHNGLGRILSNKIPATIGMQLPILEGHGEVFIFTNELYYQISRSSHVLEAFIAARDELLLKFSKSPAWVAPVFYQGSHELKTVFSYSNLNEYIKAKSDDLYKLIVGLRENAENIQLWNRSLQLINEIQKDIIDHFRIEENNIDLQIALGGNIENMRLLIKNARKYITPGIQMLRSKMIELSLKYEFGTIHTELLDNLEELHIELKKLAKA